MAKEVKDRKYSIDFYLRKTELSEPLQKMMKDLFKGHQKTIGEWKEVDKSINEGRC